MLTRTDAKARGLADLDPVAEDPLIGLIALVNADPRPDKIDVGVGVFRDGVGNTPILKVMKEAEQRLVDTQITKAYLGSSGDKRFAELLRPILLGEHAADERISGVQTPGGCGALRLGFELIATANPGARVLVGTPTWPNHPPIISAVRLEQVDYPYYERGQGAIRFEDMLAALEGAEAGDVALLHGCCHNPTGADLSEDQWREVVRVVCERGLIPLIDIAYQGFGRGLDEDAFGVRLMLSACDEVIIAQSCDKNFSVYRDRDGPRVPAGARNVVDAARPWSGRGTNHSRRSRIAFALAGRARGHARPDQFGATADRRRRPAAGVHRPAVRNVFDVALEPRAGPEAARGPCDLHGRFGPLQRCRHERRAGRSIYRRRGRRAGRVIDHG